MNLRLFLKKYVLVIIILLVSGGVYFILGSEKTGEVMAHREKAKEKSGEICSLPKNEEELRKILTPFFMI